jgi:hypothetical protein
MSYGGPVPLGNNILQGGGNSKCGDEGVGTGTNKSDTFKQYLDGLANQYNISGGGYSTDPSEFIAGLPVYKAYDDCCPPAIVGGDLKFGAPDQPVCGIGAIKGGSRNKKSRGGKRKNKKTKKQYGSSRSNCGNRRNRSNRSNRSNKQQRGGDWVYSMNSTPAPYSEAFNGPPGVFRYPDDLKSRAFDETQPNYTPNAV